MTEQRKKVQAEEDVLLKVSELRLHLQRCTSILELVHVPWAVAVHKHVCMLPTVNSPACLKATVLLGDGMGRDCVAPRRGALSLFYSDVLTWLFPSPFSPASRKLHHFPPL